MVAVPNGQDANRIRTAPTTSTSKITAWLPPGEHAVILEQPSTRAGDYPIEADGFVWALVYVCRAQDHPDRSKIMEAVGWTAAGKIDGSAVYLEPVNTTPLSK